MRKLYLICIGFLFCVAMAAIADAQTQLYHLTDGKTMSGDIVSYNGAGLVLRQGEQYSERIPWAKFSQDDLKELAKNPRIAPFAQPFIEEPVEEKPKKPEIHVNEPTRLPRPESQSLFGAMFSSGVGLAVLLLFYAGNIYAGYEVSIFRAQPAALVCGISAVLPILGPIIFLSMPTRIPKVEQTIEAPADAVTPTYSVPGAEAPAGEGETGPGGLRLAHGGHTTSHIPAAQIFQRGAFTFNRRFFETRFSGFFSVIRRDAEKDMVLLIKSARGTYAGQRITRITGNEFHVQVQKGPVSEEVMIPFAEIQEVQLKHKDA